MGLGIALGVRWDGTLADDWVRVWAGTRCGRGPWIHVGLGGDLGVGLSEFKIRLLMQVEPTTCNPSHLQINNMTSRCPST